MRRSWLAILLATHGTRAQSEAERTQQQLLKATARLEHVAQLGEDAAVLVTAQHRQRHRGARRRAVPWGDNVRQSRFSDWVEPLERPLQMNRPGCA